MKDPAESIEYVYTASETAKEIFFYPLYVGYSIFGDYDLRRTSYDSFLIMHITEGEGYIYSAGKELTMKAGDTVLVDCYSPHRYGSRNGCKLYWIHFDGVMARRYFDICIKNGPVVTLENPGVCLRQMCRIFEMFHVSGRINEADISRRLVNILTEIMEAVQGNDSPSRSASVAEETVGFMADNIAGNISLSDLAANVSLSTYYFSHIFKEEMGYSPHEYLIHMRVDKAKYLLKSTDKPIKEIAAMCGLGDACNFSSVFKKVSGYTPAVYRHKEV